MRKRYSLSLDQEKTDYVKKRLIQSGMTFSNFVDYAVSELYDNMKEIEKEIPVGKKNITGIEFLEALTRMWKKLEK